MISPIKYEDALIWDVHPELKYISPFKEIYNHKRSKKETSNIAWYVVLFCDIESMFVKAFNDDTVRQEEIESTFLKGESYHNLPIVQNAIENYPLSDIQKAFKFWKKKLDERIKFMSDKEYSEETYDMLDKMLKTKKTLTDQYLAAKAEYEKEEGGKLKGGSELSITDKGLI